MKQHQSGPVHRFERLSHLGKAYEVDRHQVDPRGWNIVGRDGQTIGKVKDLIVDKERMTARYLDVELDSKMFDLRGDPHVMVPVERAHRDGDHKRLTVEGLSPDRVTELCAARERHYSEFWDRWWALDPAAERGASWTRTAPHAPQVPQTEVRRAIEEVRPGEQVRIPVVNEEIVVERRPVHSDELVTARERDAVPPRRSTLDL
jgi:hypothetical protein